MAVILDEGGLNFEGEPPEIKKNEDGLEYVQIDDMIFYTQKRGGTMGILAAIGGQRWPNATIPVQLAAGVPAGTVRQALRMWEDVGFRFPERRAQDANFAYIYSGTNNEAPCGFYGIGQHAVSIRSWDAGTIAHEIGHLLGLQHEHQRGDRDSYIVMNWPNIILSSAFNIMGGKNLTGYDFASLMHYQQYVGDTRFVRSPSQPVYTLRPEYSQYNGFLGQKHRLTSTDASSMSKHYGLA